MKHRPIYILTGFLGAGKTTLLRRILTEAHGHKFAVIINEFGEIGLDADLLGVSQDFVKMDNGCLCCVLNDELAKTLQTLKDRDDFAAVILETTGIADPLPIAWTFFREDLKDAFRFGGIIAVVDVVNFFTAQTLADEVLCQIERADYIYLAKTQSSSKENLQNVAQAVAAIQPLARFIQDTDSDFYDLIFDVESELALPAQEQAHDHVHIQEPIHGFVSLSFDLQNTSVNLNVMEDFFEKLPKEVYRAKAIFKDALTQKIFVMHAVCGRVEFYECVDALPRGVVVIGKNLNFKQIKSLAPF